MSWTVECSYHVGRGITHPGPPVVSEIRMHRWESSVVGLEAQAVDEMASENKRERT